MVRVGILRVCVEIVKPGLKNEYTFFVCSQGLRGGSHLGNCEQTQDYQIYSPLIPLGP